MPRASKKKTQKGRPTKRTPAVVEKIVKGLSEGTPLTEICADEKMPAPRTVREWAQNDENFSAAIARARELGFDALAEQCLEIADDARNDWMEKKLNSGETIEVLNSEHVQRSKLRIETRLKLLAKWDPKRYGEKIDVTSGDKPLNDNADPAAFAVRAAALIEQALGRNDDDTAG